MPKAKPSKKKENKEIRQPIVAVMGHVDHGKTSFLDAIRGAKVAEKEFGGITQNTRAHEVTTKSGFKITFIDTPGHEAFSNMRKRGAEVTDFVALVVAADDGIQPQTKESIEFAQDNEVPIIVLVNKIDIEGVNTEKIKTELASFGVNIEEFGGDSMYFEISATKGKGLDEALEGVELLSEISELSSRKVAEDTIGEAFVLESQKDKRIGFSSLAILKSGNLDDRYFGVSKDGYFKVRAYMNEEGKGVTSVAESSPFVVSGLKDDLTTGDTIYFVKTEKEAKEFLKKLESGEVEEQKEYAETSLEDLFSKMLVEREEKKQGVEQKQLNIVIKASTQGTLEAVKAQLESLETEESKVNVLEASTGEVTERDVDRANVASGIVVAFQSPISNKVEEIARRNKIIVRNYEVIYDIIDEIADVLDGMDEPTEEEIEMGRAKVVQIFDLSDGSQVAGCKVEDGKFVKGYSIWAERKSGKEAEEVGRAKVTSVRILKEEVKEVKKGQDCGLLIDPRIEELAEGDEIVAFRVEKK